jgi:hypothetical protein
LSLAAIVSLQLGIWFRMQTWSSFPVSRIFELSGIDVPRRYLPASERRRPGPPDFVESLLDLPAIVALLTGLALLAVFYTWLASFEKELPPAVPTPAK